MWLLVAMQTLTLSVLQQTNGVAYSLAFANVHVPETMQAVIQCERRGNGIQFGSYFYPLCYCPTPDMMSLQNDTAHVY